MVNSVVELPRKQRQSVTLELGSIEGITLTCVVLDPFSLSLSALEERKTGIREKAPKLSVLDCGL